MLMLIEGQWVGARETIPVHDPYTGEVWDTVPRGTTADVERAVASAMEGYREQTRLALYRNPTEDEFATVLVAKLTRMRPAEGSVTVLPPIRW